MDKKRKLKIAQVITRLDWGGSPDIVRIICSNLDPELYDITLVFGSSKHLCTRTIEFLGGFRGEVVHIPCLKREISFFDDISAFVKLYRLFTREKFDVVHAHTAKAGIIARLAAFFAGIPVIIHTPHGHNFYGYFGSTLSKAIVVIEKIAALFTDRIIAMTELEQKDVIAFGVAKKEKISLIYQGIEHTRYTSPDFPKDTVKDVFHIRPDEFVVGMVGRLEPVKGPGYFIQAASYLVREFRNIKFFVVGEGSLRQELEIRVKTLGLEEKIIFTGWRDDIPRFLRAFDVLVLPSLNEGVGMVLLEAQALGIPVVATRVGGIPEVVQDNTTGVLVAAKDSLSLSDAIASLLQDNSKRLHMSAAAQNWMRERFRSEDMVARISALYEELAHTKCFL